MKKIRQNKQKNFSSFSFYSLYLFTKMLYNITEFKSSENSYAKHYERYVFLF